jgi:hypothetical protein
LFALNFSQSLKKSATTIKKNATEIICIESANYLLFLVGGELRNSQSIRT